LGISTQAEVARIVTYIPQQLGWEVPEKAKEDDKQFHPSPVQKTYRRALEIIESYVQGDSYGWNPENLAKFIISAEETAQLESELEEEPEESEDIIDTVSGPKPSAGPQLSTGPSLNDQKSTQTPGAGPSLGPKLQTGPKLDTGTSGPKMPTLKSPEETDLDNLDQETDRDSNKSEDESDDEEDNNEVNEDIQEQKVNKLLQELTEMERVDVVVSRIPRLFGPTVKEPVIRYCEGIRLQRLSIVGAGKQPISWINPLDAARSMIIMGDPSIDFDYYQYNVNGFTASCTEILKELDRVNHSNVKLTHKFLITQRMKHWIKSIFSVLGIKNNNSYYNYLRYNSSQTFDDSRARKEWDWEPKYSFQQTMKDSLNWYLNTST
jgi:hypothetical protein